MTIRQFQELYYIGQDRSFDMDKSVKMVGVVTGIIPDKVDKMPLKRFNRICRNIAKHFDILANKTLQNTVPVQYIRANGRIYQVHYRVDKLPITAGNYVEVMKFGEDVINNLHKIMASMCEPVKWSWGKFKFIPYKREHIDIAADMESVNFKHAYHCAVFFYTLWRVSMPLIQPYLVKELVKKGVNRSEAEKILTSLSKYLDGFTMPKWSQNMREYLLNRFGTSELSSS